MPKRAIQIASYGFPALQARVSSTGEPCPLTTSHKSSLALKQPPSPCTRSPAAALLHVDRMYFIGGTSPTNASVATIIPMALFLDAEDRYFEHEHERFQRANLPRVLPWSEWGRMHSLAFMHLRMHWHIMASDGPRIILDRANDMLDFNILGACRDMQRLASVRPTATSERSPARPSVWDVRRFLLRKFTRRRGYSHDGEAEEERQSRDDEQTAQEFGQVVRKPTIISRTTIFTHDIVTELPFVRTRLHWACPRPAMMYGGDLWVGSPITNVCG